MRLLLLGDVMLGRGVDQILPRPGDPALQERSVRDARTYVELAERANGPVPRPVEPGWPWGDALELFGDDVAQVRILNLETAVTRSADFVPGKAVHYRMNPANLDCLLLARPDVCALANNHVLDFGGKGLIETLDGLSGAGLRPAGAGRDEAEAWQPVTVPVPGGGRVRCLAFGTESSGIPPFWAAGPDRPGVAFLGELTATAADEITARLRTGTEPGDVTVASVHWGSNWGYQVHADQVRFAHRLVDGGVDVVHGHSSHHPRPVEVYRGKLVLHGCGDFVNDYEGITGYEAFRDDLRLAYLATVDEETGELRDLTMVPLRARRLRLERAGDADVGWLCAELDRESEAFGAQVECASGGRLSLGGLGSGA